MLKPNEWKHYIYWGTAFALVPTTLVLLYVLYDIHLFGGALGFAAGGLILFLRDYIPILRHANQNLWLALFLIIPPNFFLGVGYLCVYRSLISEWSFKKMFHPVPIGLGLILCVSAHTGLLGYLLRSLFVNENTYPLFCWLSLPFAVMYQIAVYIIPYTYERSFHPVLVYSNIFIGTYIASYSIMHTYKKIVNYIKNRRRVSAPPAGD